jgi:adenylate cyclase
MISLTVAADMQQVDRELGVRYVLEGSVRKAAGRVHITDSSLTPRAVNHIWADKFDGELADVFDLQERVTMNRTGFAGGSKP